MNKEFREWLEGKKRGSTYPYLNNGKLVRPNPDIEKELDLVIKKYDELHKPIIIPQYVADWITKHRDTYDLYPALRLLENNTLVWEEIYEWYRMNTHKFVNAYLTGEYEVEEEQKYYAKLKEVQPPEKEWLTNLSGPNYYAIDTIGLRLGEFILDLVGMTTKASAYTLKDWERHGINDSNADFVKVDN